MESWNEAGRRPTPILSSWQIDKVGDVSEKDKKYYDKQHYFSLLFYDIVLFLLFLT